VYVIDTKRYRGKIEVLKPLFGKPKLKIAGRDQTKLVDGLANQVAVVPRRLAKRLNGSGPLSPEQASTIHAELAVRLPEA
jgi:hypothetical protein